MASRRRKRKLSPQQKLYRYAFNAGRDHERKTMMAEFLNQKERASDPVTEDAMNRMGKPIPSFRRQCAYDWLRDQIKMTPDKAQACVSSVSEQLERDKPYEAMAEGMKFLDLTGTYVLFAQLLASEKPKIRVKAR